MVTHNRRSNNRILLVAIRTRDTPACDTIPTSVTYGGTALSLLRRYQAVPDGFSDTFNVEVWELRNPPVGTASVSVSFPNTVFRGYLSATNFYNVDQTTPLVASSDAIGTSGDTSATVSVSSTAAGQAVFYTIYGAPSNATLSGPTSLDITSIDGDYSATAFRITSGAGAQSATWTHTAAEPGNWVATSLVLRFSTGGGGGPSNAPRSMFYHIIGIR